MGRLAILLALVVAALAAAPVAGASTGSCIPGTGGPRCTIWSGKVTFVADGDTIDVDIARDGRSPRRIRLTGVQAMELTRYSKYRSRRRGACHALAATARLEDLLRRAHRRVRVAAQDPRSRSGSRLRRQISARIGGRWVDVGRALVAEGHALWLPNPVEWAWNASYRRLAEAAAARRLRLYDPAGCGPGPYAHVPLALDLNYDAPHNDADNLDGEWIRVRNPSATPVALGGWWVRDSALRRFTFPPAAAVGPHDGVVVHVGPGTADAHDFFWGLRAPAFENPTADARAMGDGAYLFDVRGNLRAGRIYP